MIVLQHTCDVGTADVDGRAENDGDSDGALVGQIDTLKIHYEIESIIKHEKLIHN